jgi:hypothetical protein
MKGDIRMSKKKECDPQKHLEAILGHGPVGSVTVEEPIALYSTEEGKRRSDVYKVNPDGTIQQFKICPQASLLTVSGIALTHSDGTTELLLSDFHCEKIEVLDPVIFVATAHTRFPVFVTAVPEVISGGSDVRIIVNAWKAGGDPAANIHVAWLCLVQYQDRVRRPD